MLHSAFTKIYGKLFPWKLKEIREMSYWESQKVTEGDLSNEHYEQFYTDHFGLSRSFYAGKRLLASGVDPGVVWNGLT